jgi:hypothetical protein
MFDLYLFNTIINTIWYIFTILFVLYKFTSFFSYMFNFVKFCGKIFTWIKYLYDQIIIYLQKKKGYKYTLLNDLESQTTQQNQTYFQKIKDNIWKQYIKLKLYLGFSHIQRPSHINNGIPLTETISNSNIKNESYYNSSEIDYFNNNIDDLNESSMLFDINNNNDNLNESSILFDINHNIDNSNNSENTFNIENSINISNNFDFNLDDSNMFQSINLSNDNSNTINSNKNYNIDSHTSILNTFFKKPTDNSYNINNSNLLFDSDLIFNTVKKSKRQNDNDPHLFEFQNNNDKKIKLDNLSNSISFTGENNIKNENGIHNFDKEITKNPYI